MIITTFLRNKFLTNILILNPNYSQMSSAEIPGACTQLLVSSAFEL